MTEKKKREKVTAEITAAHLTEFANEIGTKLSMDEAVAFLNRDGRAYAMWKRMMQAGEEYIKLTLERDSRVPVQLPASDSKRSRLAV
ncbi:MAG TPA: hypothetical protein VFI95_08750 [Terriglobales bacterium]|nr:hypothetical protein [Terriglobales bacterium]